MTTFRPEHSKQHRLFNEPEVSQIYTYTGVIMGRTIDGRTKTLALIGDPVGHSSSPAMHNYAAELLGINYAYVAFTVPEKDVPAAFDAMRTLGIRGYNVTMPDKIAAFENADKHSEAAEIIGACNTIVNDDGVLTGHITDGIGYVDMLRDNGIDIKGKKLTVCGGGGAATAITVQSALDGARAISIFNVKDKFFERTLATAEKIKKYRPECEVHVYDLADQAKLKEEIASSDIFANGTIIGMKPYDDQMVIEDTSVFRPDLIVTDAVYNPVETKMIKAAKAAGCRAYGGKGMLLWQGVAAFKLFTGEDMPVAEVKAKYFAD